MNRLVMRDEGSPSDLFQPSGVVTLLTDFGTSEPYVGIMKGVILARSPNTRLIDLTHQVPAFPVRVGGILAGSLLAIFSGRDAASGRRRPWSRD
jgi:hypothetical protein